MTEPVLIKATDLAITYGNQMVLDGAELVVRDRDRVGMVGRNGAGKSTFVKIVAGVEQPSRGELWRRPDLIVGYLPQESELDGARTVYENIVDGVQHLTDLIRRFETLPPDSDDAHRLEQQIQAIDGWSLEPRIQAAMTRLDVPPADAMVSRLSGGEKRRVSLCRALVSQPDLLILDEPTNHLDTGAIEWLETFLAGYRGACLLITHDRYFLDRITNCIVEVAEGRLHRYEGDYSDYLTAKETRTAVATAQEQKRQSFLRRELEWVRRGPKARTTKAQARLDRFHQAAAQEAPEAELDVELVIPPAPRLANRVVEITDLSLAFGDRVLFQGLTLDIPAGARIGVVGGNGVGKTSLLRALIGQLPPAAGTITVGERTRFNYVDQNRAALDPHKTIVQEVGEGRDAVVLGDSRISIWGYLKRFLFTDERINTRIADLSGGERNRVLLAKILKEGGNFLILDEPSNDLDLSTLRILEESLVAFKGCVLVVSHDRYLLNRVCNGILAFEPDGNVRYCEGNYDYYREKSAERPTPRPTATANESHPKPKQKEKNRRLTWKERKELETIEADILAAEAEVENLETSFSKPDFFQKHGAETAALTAKLNAARERVAQLYERWEFLDSIPER